jgi:hypothetical protein
VAWGFIRAGGRWDPDDIEIIRDWGYRNQSTDGIPSSISYSPSLEIGLRDEPGVRMIPRATGRLEVEDREQELQYILEALDHLSDLNFEKRKAHNKGFNPEFERSEQMTKTYLSAVFRHVAQHFERTLGQIYQLVPIELILVAQTV